MEFTMHPIEVIAVLCNVIYVILAARENIWCWLFGIVGSGISIALFVSAKLYAEAVLFVFYVVMGIYGWILWRRNQVAHTAGTESVEFRIQLWPWTRHISLIMAGLLMAAGVGLLLKNYTDAQFPLLDSFTTIFSILTTWMTAKKLLENWIYWIVLNSVSVFLYFSRDLQLYAMLSVVYVAMAVYGFVTWRSDYLKQQQR